MKIKDLNIKCKSRTILDSRGNPTTEVTLYLKNREFTSSCPSGASKGAKECMVFTDKRDKYNGKGVDDALNIIENVLYPIVLDSDVDPLQCFEIDKVMLDVDTSENKQNTGVNAILPMSLSFCKMAAYLNDMYLYEYISKIYMTLPKMPIPHFNVLNGGMHSGNKFSIQEIMIVFQHKSIEDNIESVCRLYYALRGIISTKYGSSFTSVGDEGGFAPPLTSLDEAILLLKSAGRKCGREDFKIAIDVAANSFYENGKYIMDERSMDTRELCNYYLSMLQKHAQIYSIEDPFAEDDIQGWSMFSNEAPNDLNIVADDLTVTNLKMVQEVGEKKLCNVLLVKPNQIGTVLETINAVKMARSFGMKIMVSHRSGETEDTFISDFSVGIGADYIKSGAPCRGERVCKYNQLIRINETLKQ